MTARTVLQWPNSKLLEVSELVDSFDEGLQSLAEDLYHTMIANFGAGIAAPQVGKLIRMITIQVPEKAPMIMINPNLINQEGLRRVEEGCLSVPGFTGIVERSIKIDAQYLDENKNKIQFSAEELLSQAIEHEIDHLNGIMYLDHLKSHQELHKTGITPNEVHWHDVGYKIHVNKQEALKNDLITEEVIEKKIELSKIKSDSSLDDASLEI